MATEAANPNMASHTDSAKHDAVKEYYGKTLNKTEDLATNACLTGKAPPAYIRDILKLIHPTTVAKYYGCGLCLPDYDLTGAHVLDLGCGAGRDVYIASKLVGPTGRVVGVDMTQEQLDSAREQQTYHAETFGYQNTEFVQGYLEKLTEIPELHPGSFDLIVSNCVLNLCVDKQAVLKACFDLLKPGGELYFSDVYANRRVPEVLQKDELLWGECLSGALYWNDFVRMSQRAGFCDPRLVEDAPITIGNKKVLQMFNDAGQGLLRFYSATYRLMKVEELEQDSEDYGQAVMYKGTIPRSPSAWRLDKHHVLETGRTMSVCGNTWRMLKANPRLAPHFDFFGSFDNHFGLKNKRNGGLPFDVMVAPATGSCKGSNTGACCS